MELYMPFQQAIELTNALNNATNNAGLNSSYYSYQVRQFGPEEEVTTEMQLNSYYITPGDWMIVGLSLLLRNYNGELVVPYNGITGG